MKRMAGFVIAITTFLFGSMVVSISDQATSRAGAEIPPGDVQNLGDCPGNATGYRGSGGRYSCYCSSSAIGAGSVWGTNVYTDDSAICRAAVHAGTIGHGGGQVSFSILPGQSSYSGSARNGVSTSNYGSWQGSYRFVAHTQLPGPVAGACPSDMRGFRGRNGQTLTCECSPTDLSGGNVWGTDIYTDDSKVCRAARHAGVIGISGGTVAVQTVSGQSSYAGTNRNGVSTSDYGSWQGSYRFVSQGGSSSPGLLPGVEACPSNMTAMRGQTGKSIRCSCSSAATSGGSVWGTNIYTDDSNVCRAAVHAGLIAADGGMISVRVMPGQATYTGTTRNGVSSSNYGRWQGSFMLGR